MFVSPSRARSARNARRSPTALPVRRGPAAVVALVLALSGVIAIGGSAAAADPPPLVIDDFLGTMTGTRSTGGDASIGFPGGGAQISIGTAGNSIHYAELLWTFPAPVDLTRAGALTQLQMDYSGAGGNISGNPISVGIYVQTVTGLRDLGGNGLIPGSGKFVANFTKQTPPDEIDYRLLKGTGDLTRVTSVKLQFISYANDLPAQITVDRLAAVASESAYTIPTFSGETTFTRQPGQTISSTLTVDGFPTPTVTTSGSLPPGVTATPSGTSIVFGGAPTTTGTWTYTVNAKTLDWLTNSTSVTFNVFTPASLSGASAFTARVGQPFSQGLTVGGDPLPTTASFSPTLPAGLTGTITAATKTLTISGTPTGAPGLYTGTVSVDNGHGPASLPLTIAVQGPATLAPLSSALVAVDAAITPIVITGGGFPAPAVSVTGLPEGLASTAIAGGTRITGTPTTTGISTVTVTADNGVGAAATTTFDITVASRPTISAPSPVAATVGETLLVPVTITGFPAPTAVAVAPGLPAGLRLTYEDGGWAIRGVPTSAAMGTTVVTLQADNALDTASTTTAVIVSGAPTVSGPTTADLSLGATMAPVTFAGAGFPAPVMSLKAGHTPPPGLEVTAGFGGLTLSGTPTQTGVWDLTVVAENGEGTAELPFRVTVGTAPVFAQESITVAARAWADLDVRLAATSSPSHTVSILSGTLPAGVTLTSDGRLSGRAGTARAGRYELTVQAANAFGTDTLSLSIDILTEPDFVGTLPELIATAGSPVTYTFATSGWDPPTVTALDPLPAGLTLTQSADLRTWQITGTPTRDARGSRHVRLELTNAYGVAVTQYLVITVTASPVWTVPSGRTIVVERGVPLDRVPIGVTAYPVSEMDYWGSPGLGWTRDVWTSTGVTGWITGTPSASGYFYFSICVARGLDVCVGPTLTTWFKVQERPAITVDPAVTTPTGSPVSIPITVTGSPAAALTVTGLPAGLHADPTGTGVWTITGTPDRTVLGEHTITLTANNGLTRTATIALTITGAPEVTGPVTVTAPVGVPLSGTALEATGYPLPDFSVTAGNLPPGVSLDDDGSGGLALSGTPTTLGSWTVAITATNTVGGASTSLTIDVVQAPELAEDGPVELTLREGDAFSYRVATTGYPAPTWSLTGTLPPGLTFADGVLSGRPTAGSADAVSGRADLVLSVTNAHGSDSVAVSLVVRSAPSFPAGLPTARFASGTAGTYSFTTGGWDRPTATLADPVGNPLPAGLSLTDAGDADPTTWSITGTVARELMGPHSVRIALDNAFGVRTTRVLRIEVTALFAWEDVATEVTVETGQQITAVRMTGTGFPLTASYYAPEREPWMLLSTVRLPSTTDSTSITFTWTGTPTTPGSRTMNVYPAFGFAPHATLTFHVADRPVLAAPAAQTVLTDTAVDIPVTVSGIPAAVVTATGLPSGLSVVAGAAPRDWHITGTVGRDAFGTYDVTLTADNGLLATHDLALTVEGVPVLTDAAATTYLDQAADAVAHATGSPLPTLAVTGGDLPPGLSAADDGAGGLAFTGTPTTPGRWDVTVTATNTHGTDTATVTVEVRSAPVFDDTSIEHTLREGDAVDFTAGTTGYPAATAEIADGVLPAGLTLSADGRITGTPAVGSADAGSGRYELTLRAWNGEGDDTVPVTLVVLSAPRFPAGLPTMSFNADTAASYRFTTGGWDRPSVTLLDPLPDGLSLSKVNDTTWQITGSVARALRGPHTVRVALDNAFGVRTEAVLQIEVNAPLVWGETPASIIVETNKPITPLVLTTTGYTMPADYTFIARPSWVRWPWYSLGATDFAVRFEGTPTTAGPARLTLRPWQHPGPDITITFLVTDRPVITAPATVTTTASNQVAIDVSVSGSPVSELTATGLPAGLTLADGPTAGTWQITGTPMRGALGEHTITLTADNGLTATHELTLTVVGGALLTAPTTAITTRLDEPMAPVTWTASGYPAPAFELVGDLPPDVVATTGPAGLTLDGTPTTPGTWDVVVRATNAQGTDEVTVTITVAELPTFADDSVDLVMIEGVPTTTSLPLRGFPLPTVDVVGAIPGLTVTHVPGSAPVLSGTPEAGSAGDHTLTLTARNTIAGTEQTDVITVNVRVDAQSRIASGTDALVTTVGTAVDRTVRVGGSPEPTLTAAGLPAGLTLARTAAGEWHLTGTPGAGTGGVHTVTLTADNGVLDPVTATLELTVREPITAVSTATAALRVGIVGSVAVTTSGGWPTPPALRVEGALPRGMSFIDNGNGTGRVVGTPAAGTAGTWTVTVVADNGVGEVRATLTFTVAAARVTQAGTTPGDTQTGDGDGTDAGSGDGTGTDAGSGDGDGNGSDDGSDDGSDAGDGDGSGTDADEPQADDVPDPDVPVTVHGPGTSPWWWALLSLLAIIGGTVGYIYRKARGR